MLPIKNDMIQSTNPLPKMILTEVNILKLEFEAERRQMREEN